MGNRFGRKKSGKSKPTSKEKKKKNSRNDPDSYDALTGAFSEFSVQRRLSTVPVGSESLASRKICIDDFFFLSVLGRGSFGKVCLVRKKDDLKLYALKALNKSALLKRNQIAHTKTERKILADIKHPFLVHLEFAFQSDSRLYLVLEFMSGGELFYWLRKAKYFSLERSKLYAAEVLLALEFLHTNDIIYRDLKPENILLDQTGHTKLTDFGLSKDGISGHVSGADTFCGTPEYLAPEILQNKGHGKSVDWWSLGVLLCEMLTGDPPFYNKNVQAMYRLILHANPKFTKRLGEDAEHLIVSLLDRDVNTRLGSDPTRDSLDIRKHNFFKELRWENVLQKAYSPIFTPPTSTIEKLNVDKYYAKKSTKESIIVMSSDQISKTNFDGFSYQGEEEDGSALTKLRRNSSNKEAWESLMRRSIVRSRHSSLSRSKHSIGSNVKGAEHKRVLSNIVDGDEEQEEEGVEEGVVEEGVVEEGVVEEGMVEEGVVEKSEKKEIVGGKEKAATN